MDYLMLPPEINSLRMYTGPGATPLIQAAASWAGLAAELSTTSASISQVVGGLTATWLGPSSLAMATAMSSYTGWLDATAVLAGQTANQASAAASAFEAAFMATVPPPVVAENRIRLATLVATNFLGINTPAIMATEAQYMEMWAQDVAAMIGYQEASLQAAALTPFSPLVSSVHPVSVSPAPVGLGGGILAPGSNQSTTGLAGLLNLFSGSTNSSLGSFLNSTLGNSIFSSGFYYGLPEGGLQALMSMFGLDTLGQNNQQQPQEPSGGPATYPIGPNTGDNTYPLQPSAACGQSAKVAGKLSVPAAWKPPTVDPIAAPLDANGFVGIPGVPIVNGRQGGKSEPMPFGIRPKKIIPRHPSGG